MANSPALRNLLLDGGLTVETGLSENASSPIALCTVIQIDGDTVVMADFTLLDPLSPADRQALAARHRMAVANSLSQINAEFGQGLQLIRGALLIGGAASEYPTLAPIIEHGLSALATDWIAIGVHQLPLIALLASARLLPRLVRLFQRGAQAGDLVRREVSREVYRRMRNGENLLA